MKQNNSMSVKLYGRRKGRPLSSERSYALEHVLPRIQIDLQENQAFLTAKDIFKDQSYDQIWLEIGFGCGEHAKAQALCNPHVGIIGCEAFMNGIASLVTHIKAHQISNMKIYPDDARQLIKVLDKGILERVFILFPDPWPKKRHHKRRLISESFINEVARIMKPEGELRIASDDQNYIEHIKAVIENEPNFVLSSNSFSAPHLPPMDWIETRYEQRGKRKGNLCHYLSYYRV